MTGKVNIKDVDVMVIPRTLLPICFVNGVIEVLNDIFSKAYTSYKVDNISSKAYNSYKMDEVECTKIAMIDNEYQKIFEKVKQKNKKKNRVYITELPFFVVMHRIEVPDNIWYLMIENTIKLVGEGYYDKYDKERALAGGIITTSYNMKKFEKKLKERGVKTNVR